MSSNSRILVYDYQEGYVIDAETGEVVDRIYDCSPPRSREEVAGAQLSNGSRLVRLPVSQKYYRERRLYSKARRLEERGYVVDYARLFSVGFKRSLKRESSVKLEQYFRELGILDELVQVLREIESTAPHVLARSWRAQLLIAYAVRELRAGRRPRYAVVKGVVHDSLFRKAVEVAKQLLYNTPTSSRGLVLAARTQ